MVFDINYKQACAHVKTIVLVAHDLAKELSADDRRTHELMRGVRKGTIPDEGVPAAHAELSALLAKDPNRKLPVTFEPKSIAGWRINAGMYLQDGKHYWLVGATLIRRLGLGNPRPKDKELERLSKIIDEFGGSYEHDMLTIHGDKFGISVHDVVEHGIPLMWSWINQAPLLEMHLRNKGKKTNKNDMRIVPAGTPPEDGYESMRSMRPAE